MGTRDSRAVVLVAVLGALGNILSGLSIYSAPLIPAIPLGAISISLALDLSHLSTFIGALVGGPLAGTLTGFISGALAAYQFGFAQGNIITGIALPFERRRSVRLRPPKREYLNAQEVLSPLRS